VIILSGLIACTQVAPTPAPAPPSVSAPVPPDDGVNQPDDQELHKQVEAERDPQQAPEEVKPEQEPTQGSEEVNPDQESVLNDEEVRPEPESRENTAEPVNKAVFPGTLVLGRPTGHSITISVLADTDLEFFFEYGTVPGNYAGQTSLHTFSRREPSESIIDQLQPDSRYYYRIRHREPGEPEFSAGEEHSFHTQRPPGSSFTFTVQADSHRDEKSSDELYRRTLLNALNDKPDFHTDLGDTFMSDKFAKSYQEVIDRYIEERSYFGLLSHSVPLFLINGNHEGENGWLRDGTEDNLATWATIARKIYYPNPTPDNFYTGCETVENFIGLRESYYAWEWGDALFVVLDPFWYTTRSPKKSGDNWCWTIGDEQYQWLNQVLESSQADFKFVFSHHLVGGLDTNGRGGTEAAKYYEWGGLNKDGSWGFDERRPDWDKPIHQMMVDNDVTILFHGHDHFFAKQDLEGIVYQLVPQPSHPSDRKGHDSEYGYIDGVFLPSSGHLRVAVSDNRVTVDYIRVYLPQDEKANQENGEVAYSYTIAKPDGADSGSDTEVAQEWPRLEFSEIGQPVLIGNQFVFTEGPVWDKTNEVLLFSDIRGNTIYQLTLPDTFDIFRKPSNNANGLAFDIEGWLLAAEHESRSMTRRLSDGTIETLVDNYQGKALNSPNDIVVRSDGTIYFTDPTFGLDNRQLGVDFMGLYRLGTDGTITLEGKFTGAPNGVVLSPDEKTLYLALTSSNEILAFDVAADGAISNRRVFAVPQHPDGMTVDMAGNVYVASSGGITVFASNGTELGTIRTDQRATNCAFGGPDGKTLFITTGGSIYRVSIPIPGF